MFWWEGPSTLWAFWTDLSCGSQPASSRLGWAGLGWAALQRGPQDEGRAPKG